MRLPQDASAVTEGAAATPDFTPILEGLEGCYAQVLHVGGDVQVLAATERDGHVFSSMATWNDATATLDQIATVGPLAFTGTGGVSVSVDGHTAGRFKITLDGSCAPDLDSKGLEIACERADFTRQNDTLRLAHDVRWVHTGSYADVDFPLKYAVSADPLFRAWLKHHPGCRLVTSTETIALSETLALEHGKLTYAFGCPEVGRKASGTCAPDLGVNTLPTSPSEMPRCMVLWRRPDGRLETVPASDPPQFLPIARKGVWVLRNAMAPLFIDERGAHEVELPVGNMFGTSSSSPPFVAGDSVFLERGDVLFEGKGAPPAFAPACPARAPACRFFDDPGDAHDGRGPRFVFAVKDGERSAVLRRSSDGAWSSFTLRGVDDADPVLSQGEALWMQSNRYTLFRLGKTRARYRCTNTGPHVIERISP